MKLYYLCKETHGDSIDEGSVNDTCNSDNKSDPPFYPINIPYVKSIIGRPKGSNKPFWEFSKSQRPLSLKKIQRKCEDNETSEKIQRTNDVIMDCCQSGFITIMIINLKLRQLPTLHGLNLTLQA